jgi:ADP-heptose:LPS heptosyltransferase
LHRPAADPPSSRWQWARFALRAAGTAAFDRALLAVQPAPARADRVLLVTLDAIGDFVLRLESIRVLASHHRGLGRQVVLLANASWASWARELGLADEVWALEPERFLAGFAYRAGWLRKLRAAGFALAVELTHSRRFLVGDSVLRASGAPERLGSEGDCANTPRPLKRWSDRWYTRLVPCGDERRMELLRNADFMRGLGFADFRARVPRLERGGGELPPALAAGPYAVLVPGAGWVRKSWPVPAFAEVGRRLLAQGLRLAIVGAPAERAIADALLRELRGQAEDFLGRTTLPQLAAILGRAKQVVSNDTGPAHIAAALGTPVVCILGGGQYGRFMPYAVEEVDPDRPAPVTVIHEMPCFGCNWRCIFALQPGEPVPCVGRIAVEDVWQRVAAR